MCVNCSFLHIDPPFHYLIIIYIFFLSSMCRDQVDPFDEEFGDTNDSGQGVRSEISKRAAIQLSRNVFSLASFKGELVSSH